MNMIPRAPEEVRRAAGKAIGMDRELFEAKLRLFSDGEDEDGNLIVSVDAVREAAWAVFLHHRRKPGERLAHVRNVPPEGS